MISVTVNWLLQDWLLVVVAILSTLTGWCCSWAARWLWNRRGPRHHQWDHHRHQQQSHHHHHHQQQQLLHDPLHRDSDSLDKIFKKLAELEKQLKSGTATDRRETATSGPERAEDVKGVTVGTAVSID